MVGQFFKPSWLGTVLLALLLIVWTTGIRETRSTVFGANAAGATYEHLFGYPPVVQVMQRQATPGPPQTIGVKILWPNLLFVLAAAYAVTIPLGRWITGYRTSTGDFVGPRYAGRRAPAAVVTEVVLIGFALAGFATPVMTRFMQTDASAAEITWGLGMVWVVLAVPVTLLVMSVRRLILRRQPIGRGFAIQPAEVPPLVPSPGQGEG
jgi:hypothetical protein